MITIISLNLLMVLLTFFKIWAVSNIYFGISAAVSALMLIITTPNLKMNIGGQEWKFRVPVWPGVAFFRFSFICSLILSLIVPIFGEQLIDSLQDKKLFFFNKVSNDLIIETHKNRVFLLSNSYYYDKNLTPLGEIVTQREVLLKKTVSLSGANEKMALIIFKNKYGDFVKGFEAYVPLSALKKKILKPQLTNQQHKDNDDSKAFIAIKENRTKPEEEQRVIDKRKRNLKADAEKRKQQLAKSNKVEQEKRLKRKEQELVERRKYIETRLTRIITDTSGNINWNPKPIWTEEIKGKNIFVYYNEKNIETAAQIISRIKKLGGNGYYILLGEDNQCSCPVSEICYSFRDLNAATALQSSLFDVLPTSITSSHTQGKILMNIGG